VYSGCGTGGTGTNVANSVTGPPAEIGGLMLPPVYDPDPVPFQAPNKYRRA
jgi:hypothetical protein